MSLDADPIVGIFAGLSFLWAAYAFWRDAQLRQFELTTKLSEEIEARWTALKAIEEEPDDVYQSGLVAVLNHYERCGLLLNDMRLFKSKAMKGLEKQIIEALERNWSEPVVQRAFREACTSDDTYCEIRELMRRSGKFKE